MTSPNIPVWLLDVDGVVNSVAREDARRHKVWPVDAWIKTEADSAQRTWPINAAMPVLDYIYNIHESGLAEIRWHSTWQGHALNVGRALHLPDFPIHEAPEYDPIYWQQVRDTSNRWWKLPAAYRVVKDEGRDLLWTDDDISYEMTKQQRAALRDQGRVLLVAPDPYSGLCQPDLDRIEAFLNPGEKHG